MILRQTVTEVFDSLPAGPVLRTCMQHSTAFCSRLEPTINVISGVFTMLIVLIKPDRGLTRNRRRLHFQQFVRDNFWPAVANDVLSGEVNELICWDVPVKCGDSCSNLFWDMYARSLRCGVQQRCFIANVAIYAGTSCCSCASFRTKIWFWHSEAYSTIIQINISIVEIHVQV